MFTIKTVYNDQIIYTEHILCEDAPNKEHPKIQHIVELTRGILDKCNMNAQGHIRVEVTQLAPLNFYYPRPGVTYFKEHLTGVATIDVPEHVVCPKK